MSTEQATHGPTRALVWFKSSYSGSNGGDCVEVAAEWVKSSYSGSNGGQCVEVAAQTACVHVRDSKDTSKPHLSVSPQTWAQFLNYAANSGTSAA